MLTPFIDKSVNVLISKLFISLFLRTVQLFQLQGPPGKDGLPGHPGQRGETVRGNLSLLAYSQSHVNTGCLFLWPGKRNSSDEIQSDIWTVFN